MTTTAIKEKIMNLEAQLALIKRSVFKEPDFDVDERNWTKIRPIMKKIRAKVYKETYGKK
ncbi:MAG: hypothetical protein AAB946_00660 [Patescibacteria group bacterium]